MTNQAAIPHATPMTTNAITMITMGTYPDAEAVAEAGSSYIQIHGGIGFTWEHNAHLYFKRAKSSEILLGDATYHRELLAQRIGI